MSQCPISYLTLLASTSCLASIEPSEQRASSWKRSVDEPAGWAIPFLALSLRAIVSMRPVVRPDSFPCSLWPAHLLDKGAYHPCSVSHAMHPLPCIDTMSEFNEHTVVLHLCRTALASTLLPASRQRMATVVLHLVSARRGSVGRPWRTRRVSQKSRLCGSKRNEQWSQASKICRTVLILGANKKKFHMDDGDGKVFCERFLLGNSEKISN